MTDNPFQSFTVILIKYLLSSLRDTTKGLRGELFARILIDYIIITATSAIRIIELLTQRDVNRCAESIDDCPLRFHLRCQLHRSCHEGRHFPSPIGRT